MKMIKPIPVDDTVLISSTANEDDYAAWNESASYAVGDRVVRTTTHAVYENLIAGIDATFPENATGGATPRWVYVKPTNRYAMFDDVIGTKTSVISPLNTELAPGNVSGLALLEVVGQTLDVTMTDGAGGTTVYSKSINLDDTAINSFWDYFYQDYVQKDTVALTDLPGEYLNARLIVTISGSGTVSCGVCQPGTVYELGDTDNGATIRRQDYSKKTTDQFGYTSVVKRATRKILSADVEVAFEKFTQLDRLMRDMQSELAIYIGVDRAGYETLIVYGFASDVKIVIPHPKYLMCNIEIEGII